MCSSRGMLFRVPNPKVAGSNPARPRELERTRESTAPRESAPTRQHGGGGRCADGERLDRLPEALQLEEAERFGLDDLLHFRQHPLANDDLARRRGVAEARGEVEDAADGAVVVATLEADPADRRVAERHTEREVELVPALPPP